MYRVPPAGWGLPEAYDRPPLMAIGDGLLSGGGILPMTDAHATCAMPTLLAGALADQEAAARFRRARFPAPVLLDAEAVLAGFPDDILAAFARHRQVDAAIVSTLRAWLARFRAPAHGTEPVMADVLTFPGADDTDIYEESARGFEATAAAFGAFQESDPPHPLDWAVPFPPEAVPRTDADGAPRPMAAFADLHAAIAARHLLNPGNDPALVSLRAIDQVALRRPRLLLHSLGQGNGLPDITLHGEPGRGLGRLARFAARWPERAEMLAALPREVERVVILLPPRPGGPRVYSASENVRIGEAFRGITANIASATRAAFARTPERLLLVDPTGAAEEPQRLAALIGAILPDMIDPSRLAAVGDLTPAPPPPLMARLLRAFEDPAGHQVGNGVLATLYARAEATLLRLMTLPMRR